MPRPTAYELSEMVDQYEIWDLPSTTSAWMAYYDKLAMRLKPQYSYYETALMKSDMDILVDLALQHKLNDLQFGAKRISAIAKTTLASLVPVPGLKPITLNITTASFTKHGVEAFGLANHTDVLRIYREACSKAGLVTNGTDLLKKLKHDIKHKGKEEIKEQMFEALMDGRDLKDFIQDSLEDEFGTEIAANVAEEAVHIKPVVGQAISVGRGFLKSKDQSLKALGNIYEVAEEYHKEVFATVAVANNKPSMPPSRPMFRSSTSSSTSWLSGSSIAGSVFTVATAYMSALCQ